MYLLFLRALLVASLVHSAVATSCKGNTLIILAFDGFRWSYIADKELVNFRKLRKDGVSAQRGMQSSYPTETFPNFITLATGLHPENHGIIANNMYDPIFKENFYYNTTDPKWFTDFEPIWMTNEWNATTSKDGANASYGSAVFQWPGSNVMYKGKYPRFYEKEHLPNKPPQERFDQVLELLNMKNATPPSLIMAYFEEPDQLGHRYGPDSQEVISLLRHYDKLLGLFLRRLQTSGMLNKVNIIVLADHGMTKGLPGGGLRLDTLNSSWYSSPELGTLATVWPRKGFTKRVYRKLSKMKHFSVFFKRDIPDRLYYKHHRRIPPILVMVEKGWWIVRPSSNKTKGGCHGYDNMVSDMNAIFIASGPDFKKDMVIPTFSNIHLYPLICHLLGVKAKPNNGSLEVLKSILRPISKKTVGNLSPNFSLISSLGLATVLFLIGVCVISFYRRRKQAYRYDRVSSTTLSVLESFTKDIEDDMP